MKKSKVNKLIQKFKAEAYRDGRKQGQREEQARYEELIYAPRTDGMIWLGNKPPTRDFYTVCMPQGWHGPMQFDPSDMSRMFAVENTRIDFKLKQKGLALSNGMSIRWADWEPMGPYPVVDFADPPRRRW